MKALYLSVFFSLMSFWGIAQIDSRITDLYGAEKASTLQNQQPQLMEYLNFFVNNGYTIMTGIPQEKWDAALPIETLSTELSGKSIQDLQSEFNLLKYAYPREDEHAAIFRINNSNAVLILLPKTEVMSLFNEQKGGKL